MASNKKKINKIKERGILFNTEMVKKILTNHKTQTRRIIKDVWEIYPEKAGGPLSLFIFKYDKGSMKYGVPVKIECPYGEVGDLLYVRETFCPFYFDDMSPAFKADAAEDTWEDIPEPKWKPSIHMPKEYARIWLKVKSVKFEKLRDISGRDAYFEGVEACGYKHVSDVSDFADLWDSTIEDKKYSWNSNPYVWVIKFERIYK